VDHAAHDPRLELAPDPRGSGSSSMWQSPYWARARRSAACTCPGAFAFPGDGLVVGGMRQLQVDGDLELPLQLLDGHLDVHLPHALSRVSLVSGSRTISSEGSSSRRRCRATPTFSSCSRSIFSA